MRKIIILFLCCITMCSCCLEHPDVKKIDASYLVFTTVTFLPITPNAFDTYTMDYTKEITAKCSINNICNILCDINKYGVKDSTHVPDTRMKLVVYRNNRLDSIYIGRFYIMINNINYEFPRHQLEEILKYVDKTQILWK